MIKGMIAGIAVAAAIALPNIASAQMRGYDGRLYDAPAYAPVRAQHEPMPVYIVPRPRTHYYPPEHYTPHHSPAWVWWHRHHRAHCRPCFE